MNVRLLPKISLVICALLWISACSTTERMREPKNPDPIIKGEVTEEKARQALEMKITRELQFLQENSEKFKNQVVSIPINDSTYYYKYYDEFPEGPDQVKITITSTENLSPAYTATAEFRKVRYQTRYVKSHTRAADDDDFIRDEGVQDDSYVFDGKIWRMRSAIFEVTKTSVYREDQWVATQGRVKRLEEEKPEYFMDKLRTLFGLLD